MQTKIRLICWGGGPDSTYLLKKSLEESKNPIVALCVIGDHLSEHGAAATRKATEQLKKELQKIRPFTFVEIVLKASPNGYGEDQCHTFATMFVANQYSNVEVWWGRNEADTNPEFGINELINPENVEEAENLIRLICPVHKVGYDITKAQIKEELGDLWDLTVSCESPERTEEPCNNCVKCQERASAG